MSRSYSDETLRRNRGKNGFERKNETRARCVTLAEFNKLAQKVKLLEKMVETMLNEPHRVVDNFVDDLLD